MIIRFERTMDDMIAFNDFHYSHSPFMKRFMFWYRWGGALFIFLVCTLLIQALTPGSPALFAPLLSLVGAGVFAAIAPSAIRRRMRKQVRKLYSEGKNVSALGELELELTDTGLIAKSAYTETKLAWGAIERIESTPTHTFLYLSSVQAYIIPHNKIIEGDYRALMAEIGRRFQPGQKLPQTIA
jgi:hypothetical protein